MTSLRQELHRARQAGVHGFMPQEMLSFALPARRTQAPVWERSNGDYRFVVVPGSITDPYGQQLTELPSGKYARAAMLYLCTQAKLTGQRQVELASGYRDFMKSLGVSWSGADRGKEALRQLMLVSSATFTISRQVVDDEGELHYQDTRSAFSEGMSLWTNRQRSDLSREKPSTVTLAPIFMDMLDKAVPISLKSWTWLLTHSRSPMSLDVYVWMCSRLPRCERATRVTWNQLYEQFGCTAPMKRFKQLFRDALETARLVYPEAQIAESTGTNRTSGFKGYVLRSSPDPRDSKTPAEV